MLQKEANRGDVIKVREKVRRFHGPSGGSCETAEYEIATAPAIEIESAFVETSRLEIRDRSE
jgi:hypothetical protein